MRRNYPTKGVQQHVRATMSLSVVCGPQVAITGLAVALMDIAGRRPLLLCASLGMCASAAALGAAFALHLSAAAVSAMLVYIAAFRRVVDCSSPPSECSAAASERAAVCAPLRHLLAGPFCRLFGSTLCVQPIAARRRLRGEGGPISYRSAFRAPKRSIGMGPIPWLIMSEVFPARVRAAASSAAALANWTCSFIVTLSYASMARADPVITPL